MRAMSLAQLRTRPRPRPFIDGTLPMASVCLLGGYWGTAKSFVAVSMAASAATGRPWMGRATEGVPVLYVAAEGDYGLAERFAAWEAYEGLTIADSAVAVYPDAVQIVNTAEISDLCQLIRDGGHKFVIIDTLSKCIAGLEENSASDMSRVVSALYKIRAATGDGSVLAVHHTGKDRVTVRGSSALEAGVDVVYLTEKVSSGYRLRRTKYKEGPVDDERQLALQPVPGTTSAVLVPRGTADMSGKTAELLSIVSSHFPDMTFEKRDLRHVSGFANQTFATAMDRLIASGILEQSGDPRRPSYRLATTVSA